MGKWGSTMVRVSAFEVAPPVELVTVMGGGSDSGDVGGKDSCGELGGADEGGGAGCAVEVDYGSADEVCASDGQGEGC